MHREPHAATLTAHVHRNAFGLGLAFNDANEVIHIDSRGGAAACEEVRVGDTLLAMDGVALNGLPVREALANAPPAGPSSSLPKRARLRGRGHVAACSATRLAGIDLG